MLNKSLISKSCIIFSFLSAPQINAMEYDKKMHFGVGTGIGFISQTLFDSPLESLLLCSSAGILKEIYDEVDYGGADAKDFLFTVAGCGLGVTSSSMLGIKIIPTTEGGWISYEAKF